MAAELFPEEMELNYSCYLGKANLCTGRWKDYADYGINVIIDWGKSTLIQQSKKAR